MTAPSPRAVSRSQPKLAVLALSVLRDGVRAVFRIRKRLRNGSRYLRKIVSVRASQAKNLLGFLDPFYSPPGELRRCPACMARRITHLDVMWQGRLDHASFVSGCKRCGLVFVNPLPSTEALAAFYAPGAEYAHDFNERTGYRGQARRVGRVKRALGKHEDAKLRLLFQPVTSVIDVLNPPPDAKVLDFGCGPGRLLNRLATLGWDTFGIDPALKSAFGRHRELQAPPSTPTFHLVTIHHVLEHLRNPLEVLRALCGCLRDDGVMYVSVPRLDTLAVHGDRYYCINGKGHIVAYTRDCLMTLLGMVGLRVLVSRDDQEVDNVLTNGVPRRLRIFARKDRRAMVRVPTSPLRAAKQAFDGYRARFHPGTVRGAALVSVRLRARWMQCAPTRMLLTRRLERLRTNPLERLTGVVG